MRATSSHLDCTSLVNKEFVIIIAFREWVIAEHGVILGKQDIVILPTWVANQNTGSSVHLTCSSSHLMN